MLFFKEVSFTVVEVGNWFTNLSLHATDNEAHVVKLPKLLFETYSTPYFIVTCMLEFVIFKKSQEPDLINKIPA